MSNETNQTAVEWLIEQFWNNEGMLTSKKLEQAKKMEKEQILEAFTKGNRLDVYDATETIGKQYYNETYGGNK